MSSLNVVFDLDNTLVVYTKCFASKKTHEFLRDSGGVLVVEGFIYYILPGVSELLRHLFQQADVRVSFFSAGTRSRNEELVQSLLQLCLGLETYNRVKDSVKVLSREELTWSTSVPIGVLCERYNLPWTHFELGSATHIGDKEQKYQTLNYNLPAADVKKDLTKLFAEMPLDNVVLVDDRENIVMPGQERNFLKSPCVTLSDFESLFRMRKRSQQSDCQFFFGEEEIFVEDKYQAVNSIFYLAGVLCECLQRFREGRLTNYLFNLQFSEVACFSRAEAQSCSPPHFQPNFAQPLENKAFYQKGLQQLQSLRADLTLLDPDESVQNKAVNEDEVSFLL